MATEFTGKDAVVTFDGVTLEGLLNGAINEQGRGATERKDVTVNTDTAYTSLPDPLGPKDPPKTTVTVTLQDSVNALADGKQTDLEFNAAATLVVDMAAGVANASTFTHTTMELIKRVTTIKLKELAECVLTFEANTLGTWDSPA